MKNLYNIPNPLLHYELFLKSKFINFRTNIFDDKINRSLHDWISGMMGVHWFGNVLNINLSIQRQIKNFNKR